MFIFTILEIFLVYLFQTKNFFNKNTEVGDYLMIKSMIVLYLIIKFCLNVFFLNSKQAELSYTDLKKQQYWCVQE